MEILTQAIFGLFIPLYIALVLLLSQWMFRYLKYDFIHRDKVRFVLSLATLIAIGFEIARFILGDSILDLGYYAVILLLNFVFTTRFYDALMKRFFQAIGFTHYAPTESEEQPD